jgi:hypothetical protein
MPSKRLLAALATEARLLTAQIAAMGDRLSAGKAAQLDLQNFDPMAQQAAALADLLQGLADGQVSVEALIARVPFHDIRLRLAGIEPVAAPVNETEWF